MNEQMTDNWET